MDILSRLTPDGLAPHYDHRTWLRALAIPPDAVEDVDLRVLRTDRLDVLARVRGGDPRPYTVHLEVDADERELLVTSSCSCPVRLQCKHGAAVALAQRRAATTPTPDGPPDGPPTGGSADPLEELLEELAGLAAPQELLPGVALEVSWGTGRHRPEGTRPTLRLRPLRAGRRQSWVKTGLGWDELGAAALQHAHDPGQLATLVGLHQAFLAHGAQGWTEPELSVGAFGPAVVDLLRSARDAGVRLVLRDPLTSLDLLEEPLALTADVRDDHGRTLVRVGLRHADRLWSGDDVDPLGEPAHTVALVDDDRVVLARLDPPLGAGPLRALRRTEPVPLPVREAEAKDEATQDDEPDEPHDVLRRLGRVVAMVSGDGSVPLPAPLRPRLRVTVVWDGADSASVSWLWRYGAHEPFTLDAVTPASVVRDRVTERALLARVPDAAREQVTGSDVLDLARHRLPAWRALDDVEVVETGAPHLRESHAAPVVSFATTDPSTGSAPDAAGAGRETDWLDLAVSITVDGESVPLAAVLEALTLAQEHVVLPSGVFFETHRPEFARLDALVRAAAQLHDRRPSGALRVGHDDLGLLAQLGDTGAVDEGARAWVERALALRDLVDLPRPEPTGVVSTLRHYQRDGFHWLAFLWQHGLGGILADDMGLGKTLQVLALVAHARAHDPAGGPFLVVAPTSVVPAWVGEAARHTPGLRVAAVTSSRAGAGASITELAATCDVVVTTYTVLRLQVEAFAGLTWAGLVLDEAQQVKNHRSQAYATVRRIDARFRLAVSGTPFENRLLELWSLLSIVAPGLYPRPQAFVQHVVRPVEQDGDAAALRRFTERIRPFVLRRTKEVVAADLPPKQEQVLAVELDDAHRRLYDTHLARERQRVLGLVDDFSENRVAILSAITTLRQLALHPGLVDDVHDAVGSAKTDVLVERLLELVAEGHRALVFSSFTGFLRRVRERLEQEGVPLAYLDGATRHRGEVVERFRAGGAPVFLISLKAGGTGLTLVEADYVFVLDPWWNPAAEAQAVDRAHRIGQQRTVMVYRLVAGDTVEEKVMALKARKAALFAQVVDGETGLAGGIDADDVRALLE